MKRLRRAPSIGRLGHIGLAAQLKGEPYAKAIHDFVENDIAERDLFDEEIEEYREMKDLATALVARYLGRWGDTWEPLTVEDRFEIPIRGLKAKLRGYLDAIVKDENDRIWLVERKFPQNQFRTEEDILLDGQLGVYQYAAIKLGYEVCGIIYDQILAKLPKEPKINKDGTISKARVRTDWETYKAKVIEQGLDPKDYIDMKPKLEDFEFFKRYQIYRPEGEIKAFARDMERRIWDMRRKKKHIYMAENSIMCGMCDYKELCVEQLKGGDIEWVIEKDFEYKEDTNGETTD